jgi:hypothetical protein
MDIPIIIHAANDSSDVEYNLKNNLFPNYMQEDPGMAIPYLVIICLAILIGTVGNSMVIGAVLITKVGVRLLYVLESRLGQNCEY